MELKAILNKKGGKYNLFDESSWIGKIRRIAELRDEMSE